jgi:hypothetical protein
VNETVDEDEHPNGRAHVAHTSPHAKHRARMVVGLQGRATLALCDNDERVQDLVELAQIEDPTPESESLVPQSSNVGVIRSAVRAHVDKRVLGLPDVDGRVVGSRVAESSRSVDLAQRVRNTGETVRVVKARPRVSQRPVHGDEGSEAVDCEGDIVQDDKGLEELLAGDPPRLVAALTVPGVQREDGDDVGESEEGGHFRAHREIEEPWRDAEWRAKGALFDGRREGGRLVGGRECEQIRWRQAEVDLRARHDGDARSVAIAMAVCSCCFGLWLVVKTRGEER